MAGHHYLFSLTSTGQGCQPKHQKSRMECRNVLNLGSRYWESGAVPIGLGATIPNFSKKHDLLYDRCLISSPILRPSPRVSPCRSFRHTRASTAASTTPAVWSCATSASAGSATAEATRQARTLSTIWCAPNTRYV